MKGYAVRFVKTGLWIARTGRYGRILGEASNPIIYANLPSARRVATAMIKKYESIRKNWKWSSVHQPVINRLYSNEMPELPELEIVEFDMLEKGSLPIRNPRQKTVKKQTAEQIQEELTAELGL